MPWEIRRNYGGCSGYAVVKLPDNSVSGCHTTRESARAQLRALYASESESAEKDVVTSEVTPNLYPQSIGSGYEDEKKKKKKRQFIDTQKITKHQQQLYDMLSRQEKAYADALSGIAEEYGPFDKQGSGIWVGYEPPQENEDAAIGVKCINCVFHYHTDDDKLGCSLLSYLVQENAKCRLAAIPDGLVNTGMEQPTMNRDEQQEFVDDMMERIGKAENVRVGQMVSWNSSGGRATGKVTRIIRNGKYNVPGSDFTITGTSEDPAVAIRVYRDGEPTDTIVGHKMSTLRRVGKAMNEDLENAKEILKSLEKAHHDMKEEAKAHNMDEEEEEKSYNGKKKEKAMYEDEEDEEKAMHDKKKEKSVDAAIDYDSSIQGEVPADLSAIFSNMPKTANKANRTGREKVDFTFLQGDK